MKVVHHNKDLDGYSSGAICKLKFPEAELIGYDYAEEFPWEKFQKGDKVIMVDVSLPPEDLFKLGATVGAGNFTWIDHHKSAIESFYKYLGDCELLKDKDFEIFKHFVTPVLEIGRAACEIAWEYLFPDKEMPVAVNFLGEYDTWRNQDEERWNKNILPFQFGMRAICNSAETFPQELLIWGNEGRPVGPIVRRGEDILAYQKQINETSCRRSFPAMFKDLRVICLNGGGFNSQAFDSVWDEEKYDAMMPFQFDGEKYNFSLYTTKEINLSTYAKEMGGGGHAKACGFSYKDLSIIQK